MIFDNDFDVGEGFAELCMERKKTLRTTQGIINIIRKPMSDTIIGKHFRDCLGAAFIPNLLEPTPNQCLIFI